MREESQPGVDGRPLVVGIGGTVRPHSSTERALAVALDSAQAAGASVMSFTGDRLAQLALYAPSEPGRGAAVTELVSAVRESDGLIVASPGYHGTVSGLVKNALDYLEDLREDRRPYLSYRAVGCIATATGWQATVSTLLSLRAIVHALRGWPTPLGATVNTEIADQQGYDRKARVQLETVGAEVVEFARLRQRAPL